jgi:hypothetical protein
MDTSHYEWYRDLKAILPATNNFQLKKKPAGAGTRAGWIDLDWFFRDIRSSSYATRLDSYGRRVTIPIELLWGASGHESDLVSQFTDEELLEFYENPSAFHFGNRSLQGVYNETTWYLRQVRAAMERTKTQNPNGPVGPNNRPRGHPNHRVYGDNQGGDL